MEIEKIPNRKISDIAAEKIEHWIQSGHIQPGEKLPSVRELCEAFHVGRTAIRDAITTLKGKGLVDVKHGEGTYVCQFDYSHLFQQSLLVNPNDKKKLFIVRKLLESGIAEAAAYESQPEDVIRIENALHNLKDVHIMDAWEADYELHLSIAEATKNNILVQLMETISSMMKKAMMDCHRVILADKRISQQIVVQHESIYLAIKQKQGSLARQKMLEHLDFVENLLQ